MCSNYLLLCNKLPQTEQPKTTRIYYCTLAVDQEFGPGLACGGWAGSGRGDGGLISLDSDFYGMKPFFIAPHNAPPSSPSAISCISKSQLFLDLLVELAQCLSTFHSTVLVGHMAYISSCSSISLLSSKYLLKSFTCSYAIVWVSQEADFKVILSVQGFY